MPILPRLGGALALLVFLLLPAAPVAPAPLEPGGVAPGRVIVKTSADRRAQSLRTAASQYGALSVEDRPDLDAQLWNVAPGTEEDVARSLSRRPDVEYAEPDRVQHVTTAAPNDPFYGSHQWNLPKIGVPQAWDVTTGSASVTVAVIDTGIDLTHPDGPASLRLGCDYVLWGQVGHAGACPPVTADDNGHGTHVAGIIAAKQNNAVGISGVAPGVTLLAIRTADANGSSYVSDVSAAVRAATDAGARVINLSLGGSASTNTQRSAINYALQHGVVVVAAAGNEFQDGNATEYPAAYPGVIAVAAATVDDGHASYSNTGSYVSIAAPGGGGGSSNEGWITSLYPFARGGYMMMIGTSQAAPHVAAVAGLMFSAAPSLTGSDAAATLKSTARAIGAVPNDTFGYGYLDADAAVHAVTAPSPTPTPIPTPAPVPTATPVPVTSAPVPSVPTGFRRLYLPVSPRIATN